MQTQADARGRVQQQGSAKTTGVRPYRWRLQKVLDAHEERVIDRLAWVTTLATRR